MGHVLLQPALDAAAKQLLNGQAPTRSDAYRVTPRVFHSFISYPAAGQTVPFKFFTTQPDDVVASWPVNGLAPNQFFRLDKIAFDVEPDCSTAGVYATALNAYTSVAEVVDTSVFDMSKAAYDAMIYKPRILNNGNVKFKVQSTTLFNEFGLRNFPMGNGPEMFACLGNVGLPTSTKVAAVGAGIANNGSNVSSNGKWIPNGYPIWPGETISCEVTFNTACPLSTASRIGCFLFGMFLEA